MCAFSLECGIVTESWYAVLALRRRVSMSAIGSVIVMIVVPFSPGFPSGPGVPEVPGAYGEGGVGGGLPTRLGHAGELAPVRHLAQADPAQPELAVHRVRTAAALAARVAADRELRLAGGLVDQGLLGHASSSPYCADSSLRWLLEGKAEELEQRPALVVGLRGGDHRDVHAALPVDPVHVDLVEHGLLGQPERVVAVAVELPVGQPAEVPVTGQRDGQQPVQELPHAVAAQGDLGADRHALAQLELRDGPTRAAQLRLLAGDGGKVTQRAVDELGVPGRLADTHVHDD